MRRWQTMATAAVTIASSALVGCDATRTPKAPEQNIELTGGRHNSRGDYHFDIKASSVRGLYPGAAKHIDLTIVNTYSFALQVTAVRGSVVRSSKSGCRAVASNLTVAAYGGQLPLTIPAKGRRSAGRIDVRMPNTVDNACQRATFTIRVTGSATKAKTTKTTKTTETTKTTKTTEIRYAKTTATHARVTATNVKAEATR